MVYELECWFWHAHEVEDSEILSVEADSIEAALKAIIPARYFLIRAFLLNGYDSFVVREFEVKRGQKGKKVSKKCSWKLTPEMLN